MTLSRLTFIRAALAASLLACLIAATSPAAAQKEWTVRSFAAGTEPAGNLVADSDGNLYGTAQGGGASTGGMVYELVRPVPPKTGWTERVLYSFTGGTDGKYPGQGLVFDNTGNLYGTTIEGGLTACPGGCGVVFELSPPTIAGNPWTESVLHSFSGAANGDGYGPNGELIWDGVGNLYGATNEGSAKQGTGCQGGCGTVFQLSPPAMPSGVWTETILHSFLYRHGAYPPDGPVLDSQGNLYGVTGGGGQFQTGVVYRLLRPTTADGNWSYKVLHTFGPITTGSQEGAYPSAGLILHGKRVLYGTTVNGGLSGAGTIFQLVPPTVPNGSWTENALYSFQAGSDGDEPLGDLIFDSAGNIYGTTIAGGAKGGAGTVFKLTPPASDGPWTETVLHSFHGKDGAYPGGGLIFGKNGVLFGATSLGGTSQLGGTVFGLLP